MDGLFEGLGKKAASAMVKAKWTFKALTGTEEESIEAENELGAHMAKAFLEEVPLDTDKESLELVREVGGSLADCVSNRRRVFHFACVTLPEPNAVALPGGYIFVSRQLLGLCEWDRDRLAGLLGHEIGHVVKNHAFEKVVASKALQVLMQGAAAGGVLRRAALGLVGNVVKNGYSHDNEHEADVFGVRLANAAGFHPAGLVRLFRNLQELEDEADIPYLSSHPSLSARIAHLKQAF